jgi:SAM-dependent methyltransferase
VTWQLGRTLLGGSRRQAFLDYAWVAPALAAVPKPLRRSLTLRLLAASPHYFGRQWTSHYPGLSRRAVLEGELDRNRVTRAQICDRLLLPYLHPTMSVLDFGCGPGFLAKCVSTHVHDVVAVDISRGVIACARELNDGPNIVYLANRDPDLGLLGDSMFDLVYSFAVFQHLERDQARHWLSELVRTLRPEGVGLCHFAIGPPELSPTLDPSRWLDRYRLRFNFYAMDEVRRLLVEAGASEIELRLTSDIGTIDDDIGAQHVAMFRGSASGRS